MDEGRAPGASPAVDAEVRRCCLTLAWRALCAGTLPIGAVVLEADGRVVARGRGRMLDDSGPPGRLANCPVAHAELNALAGLPGGAGYPGHTLVSSLEPCLMCVGAVGMATVGRLVYLGADPYAGATRHYRRTPFLEERPLRIDGPDGGAHGLLAMALHVAFYLRHDPASPAVTLHRRRAPEAVTLAARVTALPTDPDPYRAGLYALAGHRPR